MHRFSVHSLAWSTVLSLLCGLAPGQRLAAQHPGWSGTAQVSANALFGAAHTRLAATNLELGRADSTLSVRGAVQSTYGDDRDEDGGRRVTARASTGSLALDYLPFGRYSPFWFGTISSSLQQRIARRLDGGVGAKVTFVRSDASELSLSLAVLIEHTRPTALDTATVSPSSRARWSWRFRTRRQLTPSLSFAHVTIYQPAVSHPGSYTVDSTTNLEDRIWSALSLTATLHDLYDSEARGRGAPSNHDGQLLFGLRTSF